MHDFKLLALSRVRLKSATRACVDSGYQGWQLQHPNTAMPAKKSKLKPLTKEQKKANRRQARERIGVENAIGALKRFRILSERYRCRRKRFGLRLSLISGFRNWEIDNIKAVSEEVYCVWCSNIPPSVRLETLRLQPHHHGKL